MANARSIMAVAVADGLGVAGQVLGVMTGITESTLHNVNHGDGPGPSSRGLFQQMPSWGPLSVRMSPAGAAGLFFDAVVQVPNWKTRIPWDVAQTVQQSEFKEGFTGLGSDGEKGWNYHQNYAAAVALVGQLADSVVVDQNGQARPGKTADDNSQFGTDTATPKSSVNTPGGNIFQDVIDVILGVGAEISNGTPVAPTPDEISKLPKLNRLPAITVLPFTGAPTISPLNRLSKVLLGGKSVHADIVAATITAGMSYSSTQVGQFTIEVQDTPDGHLLRSGLIRAGATLDYADQHTDVRGITVANNKGAPKITIKGRSRVVSRMKGRVGPGNWGSMTVTQWVKDRARESGASAICQPFAEQTITRQAGAGAAPESDWDVMQRLAQNVGAIAFEYDQKIMFGKPSWLAKRPYHTRWLISWTSRDKMSPNLIELPAYAYSQESAASLTFGLIGDYQENIRPGDIVTLYGSLVAANGDWFVTGVDIPYALGAPVTVTATRIIDPTPTGTAAAATSAALGTHSAATAAGNSSVPTTGDAKGRAAAEAALTKVGHAYVYAADGPDTFDCSGLTQWAWRQQGITIPDVSYEQAKLPSVPLDQLLPGDLVTYYQPVSHVAIYVGNGNVVSAADESLGIILVTVARGGPSPTGHRVPR